MVTANADSNDLGRNIFHGLSVCRMKQLHDTAHTGEGMDHAALVNRFVVTCFYDIFIEFIREFTAVVQQACKIPR